MKKQHLPLHSHVIANPPPPPPPDAALENGIHQALWRDSSIRRRGNVILESPHKKALQQPVGAHKMYPPQLAGETRPSKMPLQPPILRPYFHHHHQYRPTTVLPPPMAAYPICSPLSPTSHNSQEGILSVTTV